MNGSFVSDERLYLDKDNNVVGGDDPSKASLLVAEGGVLPLATAKQYGLVTNVETVPKADHESLLVAYNSAQSRINDMAAAHDSVVDDLRNKEIDLAAKDTRLADLEKEKSALEKQIKDLKAKQQPKDSPVEQVVNGAATLPVTETGK